MREKRRRARIGQRKIFGLASLRDGQYAGRESCGGRAGKSQAGQIETVVSAEAGERVGESSADRLAARSQHERRGAAIDGLEGDLPASRRAGRAERQHGVANGDAAGKSVGRVKDQFSAVHRQTSGGQAAGAEAALAGGERGSGARLVGDHA